MSEPAIDLQRVAVITGVSRSVGIGAAIARRLSGTHHLLLTGYAEYDAAQNYAGEKDDISPLMEELRENGNRVSFVPADLSDPKTPAKLIAQTMEVFGRVDSMVLNHTYSVASSLGRLDAEEIDKTLAINVRAPLLLVEAFARAHQGNLNQGRIVLFSSGQRLGPMPGELAYVASKGGIEALILTLSDALSSSNITVNGVNPGPTDTGWATKEAYENIRMTFPSGRWGQPDDAARVVEWLISDAGEWITAQIIDSEGGFRRWGHPVEPPIWD